MTYLGCIRKFNISTSIITEIPIFSYPSVSLRKEVSPRKEERGKSEEERGKRKEARGHTIMIPIPRYVTLIIIDENDKFSNDQYD
jgi:hypothetical protein